MILAHLGDRDILACALHANESLLAEVARGKVENAEHLTHRAVYRLRTKLYGALSFSRLYGVENLFRARLNTQVQTILANSRFFGDFKTRAQVLMHVVAEILSMDPMLSGVVLILGLTIVPSLILEFHHERRWNSFKFTVNTDAEKVILRSEKQQFDLKAPFTTALLYNVGQFLSAFGVSVESTIFDFLTGRVIAQFPENYQLPEGYRGLTREVYHHPSGFTSQSPIIPMDHRRMRAQ